MSADYDFSRWRQIAFPINSSEQIRQVRPSRAANEELISADAPTLNVAVTGESSAAHLAMHKASEVGLNNPNIPQCLSAEGYLMLKRINI
jgi:hypothetical protein